MASMHRFHTREVLVGQVKIGGKNPIRIQSMTTSPTDDINATVDQILKLADFGCELARITVQGKKEAAACEKIKNRLLQKHCNIPLIADVHFYPPAALLASEFVEKVRINPGNFADPRASLKSKEYDDAAYARGCERIKDHLFPLIMQCKKFKRALRIGVNHGSLSDRIMNRYGNTPRGMIESALEFAHICRMENYHDFLFSMKSSNPLIMIQAYRLLVEEMTRLQWNYPLHLGVTEAGEGEDGRVKSAMGIGALLLDGIGDTIRVSLTEDPWNEIAPCKRLAELAANASIYSEKKIPIQTVQQNQVYQLPKASVILDITEKDAQKSSFLNDIGLCIQNDRWIKTNQTADALLMDAPPKCSKILKTLEELNIPLFYRQDLKLLDFKDFSLLFCPSRIPVRSLVKQLYEERNFSSLIVIREYDCSRENLPIDAGAELSALLCDKLIHGICLIGPYPLSMRKQLSFSLLQNARMRMVKTDFISCPGCGRTLFDLQTTSKRIREKTSHLPGVKIAIMGCIVNGPGELADADFGYVGSKPGKVDLYIRNTCVGKNIDFSEADDKLIQLIQSQGKWVNL